MTAEMTQYKFTAAIGNTVKGIALCAADDFSARYDLDRIRGVFSRPEHLLYGENYVGKILVLNTAKGGVASSWMLLDMASRDQAPLALVMNSVNPIMVQGAAFANMTLVHGFETDITSVIQSGDSITVDLSTNTLTINSKPS